jgi:hypothetical protein
MEIKNIKEISDATLTSLDVLAIKDCQPGTYSLIRLREMAKHTDILYLFEKEKPIYFLLLDRFTKHKMVYIHDVCVSQSHRGKSIFKKSLTFLKRYYLKRGYTSFTLDASDSTKEKGLDQKARLHIFHSAGFDVNTETGYFTKAGEYKVIKTIVVLDTNETVEIQKREGSQYHVKNKEGKKSVVSIRQIEKCLDSESNPISCPMIMYLSIRDKRTTRKKSKQTL